MKQRAIKGSPVVQDERRERGKASNVTHRGQTLRVRGDRGRVLSDRPM